MTQRRSLNNWLESLDLTCSPSYYIGLFSSIELFGFLFGSIILAPKADIYGRKKFIYFIIGSYVVCYFLICFVNITLVYYIVMFFVGVTSSCRSFIMYTVCMEFVSGKENLYTGIIFFIDEMTFVWSPLVLVYITKNARILNFTSLLFAVILFVSIGISGFPESVKWLLA